MRVDAYCAAVACQLTTAQQATLWMLSSYVNRHSGETFVSIPTIANRMGIADRHVREHVGALIRLGVIRAQRRSGRSTIYRFPVHPAVAATPDEFVRGSPGRNGQGSDIHTPDEIGRGELSTTPDDFDIDPGRFAREPLTKSSGITSNNRVKEPRGAPVDNEPAVAAEPVAIPRELHDEVAARAQRMARARELYAEFGHG